MAQRVNAISFRLGLNLFWQSQWYSKSNYESLFHEDILIETYLKNIFENRGIFFKRLLIKRTAKHTFLFLEVYGNPYFKYAIPEDFREFKKFQTIISTQNIKKFLQSLSQNKVHLSIYNLFLMNRIHRKYMTRLRGQFWRYKKYRFTVPVLNIFTLILRTKGAGLLTRVIRFELELIEQTKKNKIVWRFASFLKKLIDMVQNQKKGIHGIRLQIKGRFKGRKRPTKIRYGNGMVPFNTFRAHIDYSYSVALTINGSYGIKVWICYKDFKETIKKTSE
jgi:hypothetical protein